VLQALDGLVEEIARTDGTDASRLHVSGFSMGGIGAFCVALRQPARFASLSSVCGRCQTPDALPELAGMPAWIAYAENDEITELTNGSKDAIRRLAQYGNLTEMPYRLERRGERGPHVLTCDAAYAEPALYQWLLARRRQPF
jgi:predicted peptidase